jgi:hypothetical protein
MDRTDGSDGLIGRMDGRMDGRIGQIGRIGQMGGRIGWMDESDGRAYVFIGEMSRRAEGDSGNETR